MPLKSRIVLVVVLLAAIAGAGPVVAADGARVEPVYLEAEELLPALEGFASNAEGTEQQAIARRESVDEILSGNAHVLFENATEGNRFTLRFPVPVSAGYTLVARFTRAPGYGVVQAALDGRPLGGPVDLYAPTLGQSEERVLGRVELARGDHTFTVTVQGKSAASTGLRAGLDFIELRP